MRILDVIDEALDSVSTQEVKVSVHYEKRVTSGRKEE